MSGHEVKQASRNWYLIRQSGAALLAMAAIVGLVAAIFVLGLAGSIGRQNTEDRRTAEALAQAKEALIGYAANYRDSHPGEVFGYLPCPDLDNGNPEGSAEPSCGAKNVTIIGRLPWRTLGLPPLRDGSGECLWYAVSGSFKYNPKTDLMNWDTNGLIEVRATDGVNLLAGGSGTTPDPLTRAAAVIFAPGAALTGQNRAPSLAITPPTTCGGNYIITGYLESASGINNATPPSSTPNAVTTYIAATDSRKSATLDNTFNDRLVFITPGEIFAARSEKRADFSPYLVDADEGMLKMLVECVAAYGQTNITSNDKRLPWTAPTSLGAGNYGTSTSYNDSTGTYAGRFPYIADNSATTTSNSAVQGNANRLLNTSLCPGWPASGENEFWANWKEQVFYAIAPAFRPTSDNLANAQNANPCASADCLSVVGPTGTVDDFAAVLIFSGKKQAGQSRNTDAQRADTQNYLEGVNATAMQNPTTASARTFSMIEGNDTVMCVKAVSANNIVADPTCSVVITTPTSSCPADGAALAAYRSGNTNNCKVGRREVLQACRDLERSLDRNNCSCERGARDFIQRRCLDGFGSERCQDAYNDLLAC